MKRVAITGGKGGTGKSTIATALAVLLGEKYRVLLVDADVDCPNDHLLLGIKRKQIKTVKQRIPKWDFEKCIECGECGKVCKTHAIFAVKGKKPIFLEKQCNGCGACKIVCREKAITWSEKEIGSIFCGKGHGIELLSGELKASEPVSEFVVSALNEEIEIIGKNFDFVVVDTAAGTHCDVIGALEKTDIAFAVTEPTPLGEHDLELIAELLETIGIKFEIVLNRFEGSSELIEKSAERHGKKIIAIIPFSKKIMQDYCNARPVEEKGIEELKRCIE